MLGFSIFAEHANETHPVGDPTKKREHEAAYRGQPIKEFSGRGQQFMTPLAVVKGLLPPDEEKMLLGIVKSEVSRAENELDFRRGMISRMLERRYEPTLRRAVMDRALNFYRSSRVQRPTSSERAGRDPRRGKQPDSKANQSRFVTKSEASKIPGTLGLWSTEPSRTQTRPTEIEGDQELSLSKSDQRGGTYHRRHPKPGGGYRYIYSPVDEEPTGAEAHKEFLKRRLRRLVDKAGPGGCAPDHEDLRALVAKHGARYVAEMLHAGGARNKDGKICYGDDSISKGLKVAPSGAGGTGGGSDGSQPGERKIWNNRIVEKQADGKWKVVGHVAGFGEGEKIPRATKLRETAGAKPKPGETAPGSPKPVIGGHPTHPELRSSELTKEQAAHLIQQLKDAKEK